jgi:hypothetical protein
MVHMVTRLRTNPIAHWHARIRGTGPREAEKKRIEYYEALRTWLEGRDAGAPCAVKDARTDLDRLTGHTSSSTLYSQLGRRPLAETVCPGKVRDALENAEVVTRLTAEAKIWDHWDHRTGWLGGLARTGADHGSRFAATTLIRVLAVWAAASPALAMAEHCAPPLTAVEDLCLALEEQVSFDDAVDLLTRVIELAVGPLGVTPGAVVDAVFDDLMRLGFEPAPLVRRQLERALGPLHELAFVLRRLPAEVRADVGGELVPQFEQVMRMVNHAERST